jgi:creatinine amidohydrolase
MVDWRNTSEEVRASGPDTAVINIGSIEQHGPHLPVGTDTIIGGYLAREVARSLGAYLLPSFAVGNCQEHMGRAGTVWLKTKTLFAVVSDVCLSLLEQGFHRVVIIPSHGGLWVLKPAVRELNLNHPDLIVLLVPEGLGDDSAAILTDRGMDLHAGEAETSMMLHLDPATVKMELAVDGRPAVGREYLDYVTIGQLSPSGVWGAATQGTAAKGRLLLEGRVEAIVEYCRATFEQVEQLRGQPR